MRVCKSGLSLTSWNANQLGAEVTSVHGNGCPPVHIGAHRLRGGTATISGAISSQFLSALLMVAPYAEQDVTLVVRDTLVSVPYVDLTLDIMARFGVEVTMTAIAVSSSVDSSAIRAKRIPWKGMPPRRRISGGWRRC